MWLALGISEVFGLASRIGYELRGWQVEFLRHSAICGGLAVESNTKLCGSQVGFLRHLTMWAVSRSAMKLCGRQMNFLRYLAMRAGHLDQVGCYVTGE